MYITAISLSIDSFGVGITYGIRNIEISFKSRIMVFLISFIIVLCSNFFGAFVMIFFPKIAAKLFGSILIVFMGIWIIVKSYQNDSGVSEFLKDPALSDFDGSKSIDIKEAFYLGLATSLDSIICGIGFSTNFGFSVVFPLMVSAFQLIFLSIGIVFGKKIKSISTIPTAIWSRISGMILILLGIIKALT